ncbi:hypothetical protein DL546_003624 [Coniochaeta pulveracea]|uniref:Uncharacterized protein n=1 Tax=Coniochaeta pulveracea TaxID=177199 RepID=A0A420XZQ5_9PEZI|nr:hypothetical protein DL546_003624 [Coniochaeta pulveracea]
MLISAHFLRRLRAHRQRALIFLTVFLIIDTVWIIASRPSSRGAPIPLDERDHPTTPLTNSSVYIVSVHRNTEAILRSAWSKAVLDLVTYLGPSNVYFSAIESGSQDGTKDALKELKSALDSKGIGNTIELGKTAWEQMAEIENRPQERQKGWIWDKAEGHWDVRRIPYLSRVRNQAMEPLRKLNRKFDKVLWLNDVVFDLDDYLALLHTRDGHFAAACSMDYKHYPYYYDTFALRDENGWKTASYFWPWFRSSKARASTLRAEPVKVESCWNGMVLFDSAPFIADPPLEFRGIEDSLADLRLEASECCLIHVDNALSRQEGKGVWLNPNVRVGYDVKAYEAVKGGKFPGPVMAVAGTWAVRLGRVTGKISGYTEDLTVQKRMAKWRAEDPSRKEPGEDKKS